MYILKYYSNSWFIFSIYLSIYQLRAINNFVSISNISFNFFINLVTSWGLLSEIILSDNLCNFYILFLNNFANSFAVIFTVVAIKYNIFKNYHILSKLSHDP